MCVCACDTPINLSPWSVPALELLQKSCFWVLSLVQLEF